MESIAEEDIRNLERKEIVLKLHQTFSQHQVLHLKVCVNGFNVANVKNTTLVLQLTVINAIDK